MTRIAKLFSISFVTVFGAASTAAHAQENRPATAVAERYDATIRRTSYGIPTSRRPTSPASASVKAMPRQRITCAPSPTKW